MPRQFHINLPRKCVEREGQAVPAGTRVDRAVETAAVIDDDPDVEGDVLLPECDSEETHADVRWCPELTQAQKDDVRGLLSEFQKVMTDKPSQSRLEPCDVELTSKQPAVGKGHPVRYATREVISEDVDRMLKHWDNAANN